MTSVDKKLAQNPRPVSLSGERHREREKLLAQLVYETDAAGKPIYYEGYREVLHGTVQQNEIMGSSSLQSLLVHILLQFFYTHPLQKKFKFLSSEIGVQIARKKWRSCDLAIYHRERLKDFVYTNKYIDVSPGYVIEIDTKADLSKYKNQQAYFIEKTQQLHEFGVKKMIWIFTENIPLSGNQMQVRLLQFIKAGMLI